MEQFHHFGSVFVKEDRETGKVVQKPCLFVRQNRAITSNGLSLISEPVTYQWGVQGGPECTSPRGPVTYQWGGQGGPECTSPRGPGKKCIVNCTKFTSDHNSQLFTLYKCLVHVGETFSRSELHRNAFGGWTRLGSYSAPRADPLPLYSGWEGRTG